MHFSFPHYLWECLGVNGGSDVSCSKEIPVVSVNGICGTARNSCDAGSIIDIPDTSTEIKWNCGGSNGGITAPCQDPKTIVAGCETPINPPVITFCMNLASAGCFGGADRFHLCESGQTIVYTDTYECWCSICEVQEFQGPIDNFNCYE